METSSCHLTRIGSRNRMVEYRPAAPLLRLNLVGNIAHVARVTCVKCGASKSLSEFHKVSAIAAPWEVRADCKTCFSARTKEYRSTHKQEIWATVEASIDRRAETRGELSCADRRCVKCGAVKPVRAFSRDRRTVSGFHGSCAECIGAQRKSAGYWSRFYETHRAAIIEATAEYARAHPESVAAKRHKRRAFKKGAAGTCSAEQLKARFEVYGNCCAYCGDPADSADHVIALAAGGSNWPANIRPACTPCNSSKGAKKLSVWKAEKFAA